MAWHDLYKLNIAKGELTLIRENHDRILGWSFDWDEKLRLATRSNEDGSTEILRVDEDQLVKIYDCGPLEECNDVAFDKENKRFYLITNKGTNVNFTRLMLFDPDSGNESMVENDPENRVDFGGVSFSDLSREMILTFYTDAKTRRYWKDAGFEADFNVLQEKFPGMEISMGSGDKMERKFMVTVSSDTDPASVYLFDRDTKELTFQYRPRPKLPIEHLSPMQVVNYLSSDGLEIPAYLTIPKGMNPKNLPLLVIPHGGPWARDYWGYDAEAQFWSNRGYAVLQMNFRGSTGYGKAFLDSGNLEWGDKMQDDITWGVKYLVEQGIADPARVGILGGSYGGYATLAGVTFTPDLYKAAVAFVAPSNLNTLLGSIPPYWESARTFFKLRMGNPDTEEGLARLERQSPLNHVEKIRTPLMVVQGANDPRVKQSEADQIIVAMRERNIPVEYILADDEGHGFRRPVNNMAYMAAAEEFLAKHLGGRFQKSMKPDVEARLKELRVDISTVKMPEKADAADIKSRLAKPVRDLVAGKYNYRMQMSIQGQEIEMAMTRTVEDKGDHWLISDLSTTPMGEAKDVNKVAKISLLAIQRNIEQGQVKMEILYGKGKIEGIINMNGQQMPINISSEDALLADGAGFDLLVASLPLDKNYLGYIKVFDAQQQKIVTYKVHVDDMENIEAGGHSYDTYRAKLQSEEGHNITMWVDIKTSKTVKISQNLPQLAGATLVTVLTD
ncbi:MAG: S9 family peptidase [Cyclobacteriaceae bacterium]|nr:S9 family peptidase [Cyclobacteriaceae bacterium]